MNQAPSGASGERAAYRIERQLEREGSPLALPLALVLLIGLAAGALIRLEYQANLEGWRVRLRALADVRAASIELWLRERHSDVALVSSFPTPRRVARDPQASDSEALEQLPEIMEESRLEGFARGIVLRRAERTLHARGEPIPERALEEVGRALAPPSSAATIVDRDAQGAVRILIAHRLPETGEDVSFVAMSHDPLDGLESLLGPDSVPTRTGEVLLVTHVGADLLYFAGLRFHTGGPLVRPPSPAGLPRPADAALLSRRSVGEYLDYRDVRVLAATRRIEGSTWGLVTKVDRAEVLATWRKQSLRTALAALGLATIAVGLVTAASRSRHRRQIAALAVNEERLRLALSAASQGLWDLDVPSGAAVVDAGYARMLGHDPLSFQESHAAFLERLHPDDRGAVEQGYRDYLEGRRAEYRTECRQRTATGEWKWILSTGAAMERDADGRPLRMLGIHTDVDRRRRAEDDLRQLTHELEDRVRRRTSELEIANRELEAFSYSVSHDLRAPLRAIDGFSRLVEEEHARQLDAEGHRLLGIVRKNTHRMGQLIDDLLAFSRASRQPVRRARVALGALAEEVLREVLPEARCATTEVGIAPLPEVEGDPALLRQVFVNLLSNAVKFTSTHASARISIRAEQRGPWHEISITDDGVGFDPRYVDKLFGVFQRLHGPSEFPGTGVGLALVRRIVERHGGTVEARGMPEGGATFTFTLPAEEERE